MRRQLDTDFGIAAIAERQGGVASRARLLRIGLSASAIDRRVQGGRLHILHRGVYSVGHRVVGVVGRQWAAVLACGPEAALSHGSAGAAWNIRASAAGTIDVTVRQSGRARKGIRVHRISALQADEVTELNGLAITTPARTLLDLAAGGLSGRQLEAAVDRAELLRLLDFGDLERLLAR